MPGCPCSPTGTHQGYRYLTRAASSPCTLVETAQSPPVAQYRVPTPPLQASPLVSSSPPVLDIKEPLNLLLWMGRFEQKAAEAAAQAAAPTDILPGSSTDGQMLPSTHADQPANLHPARSVQYPSWTVTAHCPVTLAGQLTCYGQASKHIKKIMSLLEWPSSPLPSKLVHLQSSLCTLSRWTIH